jgi:hypothetical protein
MASKKDNFTYCFKKGVKFDPSQIGVGSAWDLKKRK